jgi:hypothetical protein
MGALGFHRKIAPPAPTIGISIRMHLEKQITFLLSDRAQKSPNREICNLPHVYIGNLVANMMVVDL